MFSPIVSLPLMCRSSIGLIASYCAPSFVVRSSKAFASVGGPPVAQVALAVRLAPLIVEAVADLVADHGADRAVVHGVVRVHVEERRLQDAAGKMISLFDGL